MLDKREVNQGWAVDELNGSFYPYVKQRPATSIPSGIYTPEIDRVRGPFFHQKAILSDRLIMIEDSVATEVLKEIREFTQRKEEFRKRGFIHKRGIMLPGAPGSGKTATITMITRAAVKELDAVVLYMNNLGVAKASLPVFRRIEPERLLVGVIEDIDNIIAEGDEEELLSLLDGEDQVGNIVFIATTNYPENLPPRVWDRPSRFDTILFVEMPSPAMRAEFLKYKEPTYTDKEIDEAVKLTEGFSIAHLKEFIILNKCFGKPIKLAAKRINDTRHNKLFQTKKEEKE